MKKLITASFIFFILVGTMTVVGIQIGLQPTFLRAEYVGNTNIVWYKIDIMGYLNNLAKTVNAQFIANLLIEQPGELTSTTTTLTWNLLFKAFAHSFNWFIYILNTVLFVPIRVIAVYPNRMVLALLGFDSLNLTQILDAILTIQIPYIPIYNQVLA